MATSDIANWISGQADILKNIAKTLPDVQMATSGFAYVIGLVFAFKAIHTLKGYGESRAMQSSGSNMKEPIIYLLVAAIFIWFPTGLNLFLTTTFGKPGVLSYQPTQNGEIIGGLFNSDSEVGRSLALLIQTIGGIAFVRGWILIARSASQGQQPGGMGKGLTHVFGGILAINIVATLEIINNTLYGGS